MTHSILPPSSAGIWGKTGGCTAWPLFAPQYPEDEETIEAKEGTAVHEIAAHMIEGLPVAKVGDTTSNGINVSEEMIETAAVYADDVVAVANVVGRENLRVEQRIEIPRIHPYCYGTPDASNYHSATNRLYVWDLKNGFGVVEAFENYQGVAYVAGLLDLYGINGQLDQETTVHIRIVQPRAFHRDGPIREWIVKASDLRAHINIMAGNAAVALGDKGECVTGEHCRYCPARHACPAALKTGMTLFETVSKPIPSELPPTALGIQMRLIKRAREQLEYLETGYEAQLDGILRKGGTVPGWTMQEKFGRERWNKPVEEVIQLGDMMGISLAKPTAVTPLQAKKLGIDAAVISAYSIKPPTGLKLVPDNDNKARKVFDNE